MGGGDQGHNECWAGTAGSAAAKQANGAPENKATGAAQIPQSSMEPTSGAARKAGLPSPDMRPAMPTASATSSAVSVPLPSCRSRAGGRPVPWPDVAQLTSPHALVGRGATRGRRLSPCRRPTLSSFWKALMHTSSCSSRLRWMVDATNSCGMRRRGERVCVHAVYTALEGSSIWTCRTLKARATRCRPAPGARSWSGPHLVVDHTVAVDVGRLQNLGSMKRRRAGKSSGWHEAWLHPPQTPS